MKYSFIEIIIATMFIVILVSSYQHKTSPEYEIGKYIKQAHDDFIKGFNAVDYQEGAK